MRILLDKNVPVQVRRFLTGHEIGRADRLAWGRLKNGTLPTAAKEAGFDLIFTADQNLTYQQNLTGRKIALVVLGNGNWPVVQNYLHEIATAVATASGVRVDANGGPLSARPKNWSE